MCGTTCLRIWTARVFPGCCVPAQSAVGTASGSPFPLARSEGRKGCCPSPGFSTTEAKCPLRCGPAPCRAIPPHHTRWPGSGRAACGQGRGEHTAGENGQRCAAASSGNLSCTRTVTGMCHWSSSQHHFQGRRRQRYTGNKPGAMWAR